MNARIVQGGWDGHQPKLVAELFREILAGEGFAVEVSDTLDSFVDEEKLKSLALIVPIWTMGRITGDQCKAVCDAVASGVGLAGCHGGMCDAFRDATEWQFMTGGQWVAHPGNDGVKYAIHIKDPDHPVTAGLKDFAVASEQYYMHVDPAVRVLATTTFPTPGASGPHEPNGFFEMPQVWTKYYGKGRVFFNALGHHADVFAIPEAREMMRRGFNWAAKRD